MLKMKIANDSQMISDHNYVKCISLQLADIHISLKHRWNVRELRGLPQYFFPTAFFLFYKVQSHRNFSRRRLWCHTNVTCTFHPMKSIVTCQNKSLKVATFRGDHNVSRTSFYVRADVKLRTHAEYSPDAKQASASTW